jgi:uncharacterized SAM-binding protein YcdF (DUF218 family)
MKSGTGLLVRPRQHRRRKVLVIALSIVLVLVSVVTARMFIWPDLPAVPAQVDAIIELGGPGNRDAVTLELARAHRAPVAVQSTTPDDARSGKCLPSISGVTILCFHAEPNTTRGEARYIGTEGQLRHWRSVIVVTSPDHAWRARLEIGRCFTGDVYVVTTHLPALAWLRQIPYQWVATTKALIFERSC